MTIDRNRMSYLATTVDESGPDQRPTDEAALKKAASKLASIVQKYKKYERLDPDTKGPSHAGQFHSPRYGMVEVVRDVWAHDGQFKSLVAVGVKYGSKFGEPTSAPPYPSGSTSDWKKVRAERKEIVDKLKAEVGEVLRPLMEAYGGRIRDSDGSAFSLLGWVAPKTP